MELFDQPIPDLPGVPAELIDVLRAGMANDPAHRPTAAQLRDWLTAVSLEPVAPPVSSSARYHPWPATTPPSPVSPGTVPGYVSPGAGPDYDGPTNPLPDHTPTVPNARRRGPVREAAARDSAQPAGIRSRPEDDR